MTVWKNIMLQIQGVSFPSMAASIAGLEELCERECQGRLQEQKQHWAAKNEDRWGSKKLLARIG